MFYNKKLNILNNLSEIFLIEHIFFGSTKCLFMYIFSKLMESSIYGEATNWFHKYPEMFRKIVLKGQSKALQWKIGYYLRKTPK